MTGRIFVILYFFCVLPIAGCDSGDGGRTHYAAASRSGQMSDSSQSGLSDKIAEVIKDSLITNGDYECCTRPGCLQCVKERGRCTCYADLKRKDPICGQCLEGYKNGEGKLKLVSIPELERIRNSKTQPN